MRKLALYLLVALAGACSLKVDYTGTYYQCNPDGSCPPDFECREMVCVPTDPAPPACSRDVSAGGGHACAVREDGSVWCWGRNDSGQLGDGTGIDSDIPVRVTGLTAATHVRAGDLFSCALDTKGEVYCWGRNDSGQLGDGTTSDSRAPVKVLGITGATEIAVGFAHACALKSDGTIACWGANADGELGDGTTTARGTPATVSGLTGVKKVRAGGDTTCVILGDGTAQCMGENNDGELGVGDTMARNRPTPVVDLANIDDIATGDDFTCALTTEHFLYCWGLNDNGQLATGNFASSNRPVPAIPTIGLLTIEAGNLHACGLDEEGRAWCWGYGGEGRLFDGGFTTRTQPTRSLIGDTDVISAGSEHTCALDKSGAVRCAGFNRRGQLGDGRRVTFGEPQKVSGISKAVKIAAGARHTCASVMDGRVMCWGENDDGEVGDGAFSPDRTTPQVVSSVRDPLDLVAGAEHTCALLQDGSVFCWGDNDSGQLGNGSTTTSAAPRRVDGLSGAPQELAVGDRTTCAIYASSAQCWGNLFETRPQDVPDVKSVAGGDNHVCTVGTDGVVRCFGRGSSYQLGQNAMADVAAPGVEAIGVANAAEFFGRGNQSCAVLSDGTAKCWGLNENVRLGTGMNSYFTQTPAPVMGLSGIADFALGYEASCALKTDGALACWGRNYNGQVGDTTYQDRGTPVQLLSLSNVAAVASGASHSCAIDGGGDVWCWGSGTRGQLGNGVHSISRPVGVEMTCP
jgi:alpha-tubulin suppressor-like RCC1 family protein